MEQLNEIKQLISEAKNICLIPSQNNEPESLTSALALFYTLKELNKNVNLITEDFPEKMSFLIPSLDFITSPKNFVISIPQNIAEVSQIYYEKNEKSLKIHLTVDRGHIKKEDLSFYFSDSKPDLVITLGIQDFTKELTNRLDSFGFILDTPIINIDNNPENIKFGKINLIEDKSISEITLKTIKSIHQDLVKKDFANCILTGLIIHYENFRNVRTSPEVFETAADLIKKGADYQQIINNLYKTTEKELYFFSKIFQGMRTEDNGKSVAILDSDDFQKFSEQEASLAVEKIKTIGIQNDLLVLWRSHASDPMIKGFFYSKKQNLINRVFLLNNTSYNEIGGFKITAKNDWAFLSMIGSDINLAKEQIIKSLV